jgi:3-deoxy-D-manno-octulosonic acid kinase
MAKQQIEPGENVQQTSPRPNTMIWYDSDYISNPDELIFSPDFWKTQSKVLGSAEGRGTTWFVETERLPAALRHYRRGGLFGKLVRDQYWFNGWNNTRSFQEFTLLSKLVDANVNVPRPLAALAVRSGLYYRADLLSEKIANAQDLVAILQDGMLDKQAYHRIGAEIRAMHDIGVNHTDLNIHNVLIDDQQKVWIIDFDKCSEQPGEGWKQDNLNRLKRSFEKELGRYYIHWQPNDFETLLAGYKQGKR